MHNDAGHRPSCRSATGGNAAQAAFECYRQTLVSRAKRRHTARSWFTDSASAMILRTHAGGGGSISLLLTFGFGAHTVQRGDNASPPVRVPVGLARLGESLEERLRGHANDVVMAVCAGGPRRWLERQGALPDDPLVAVVPVSIRTGNETEKWSNRVSQIFAALLTNEPDAVARVHKVRASTASAKQLFDAVPAAALTDFTQFAPPAVFAQAMRTATRLSGSYGTPVNLVISNVPGPRQPLYAARAQLLHFYPVSTIVDGQGFNITVQSYLGWLDFGLVSCRELVPDLWDLLDDIVDDVVEFGHQLGVQVDSTGDRDGSPVSNLPAKRPAAKKAAPRRALPRRHRL